MQKIDAVFGFLLGLVAGVVVAASIQGNLGPTTTINLDEVPYIQFTWQTVELESIDKHSQFWTDAELKNLVKMVKERSEQIKQLQQAIEPVPSDSSLVTR